MNTPPPVPTAGSYKGSLFHKAAKLALLPALMVLFLSPLEKMHLSRGPILLLGVIMVCLLLLGLVLSIVALCGIQRHGTSGLLGFGVSGLGINGLILFIFITNFATAHAKSREQNRKIDAVTSEFITNAAQNYNPTSGVDGEKQLKLLADYRQALNAASQGASGDDASMMQAAQSILQKIQAAGQKVVTADKRCDAVGIFDFETLTNRNDLAPRRQAILNLKAANSELRDLITNRTALAVAELRSRGVPEGKIQEFIDGFKQPKTQVLAVEMRNYVDDYCDTCLGLQDVLDHQWGRWRFDPVEGTAIFDEPSAQKEFGHLASSILAIRKKEIALQGELLKRAGASSRQSRQ